ncbi:MAG: GNAT family N-acetyltransferase [Selenomonadaceae bacterium]|nr:GNAT family N-acetyltransferase [Selenomonadaceae bacterium]
MNIRNTTLNDLAKVMTIYERARKFMAANGNPNQWGGTNWPPEDLIRNDIAIGKSFVCIEGEEIVGTFYYDFGKDIEPTYEKIYEGAWLNDSAYGVVHRLAASGTVRGVGKFCMTWAFERSGGHIRVDTHPDNKVLQHLLSGLGYKHCGTIFVAKDNYPRLAYEKF